MVPRHPGKEPMEVPETNTFEYADDDHDHGYFEDDYYPDEVASLKQQLDEALRASEALTLQVQEAQRNPPGKSRKKASKKMAPADSDTATVHKVSHHLQVLNE